MTQCDLPRFGGFGLGMRSPHYPAYLSGEAPVDFVEIISENYMVRGGRPLEGAITIGGKLRCSSLLASNICPDGQFGAGSLSRMTE